MKAEEQRAGPTPSHCEPLQQDARGGQLRIDRLSKVAYRKAFEIRVIREQFDYPDETASFVMRSRPVACHGISPPPNGDITRQLRKYGGDTYKEEYRGVRRHVLASSWRMRECGIGRIVSRWWYWLAGSFVGVWFDGTDHGLRNRAYLGLPPESGSIDRTLGWRSLPHESIAALHRLAGPGRQSDSG